MKKARDDNLEFKRWLKDMFAYTGPSPYIGKVEIDGVHWYKWNKKEKRYEEKKQIPQETIGGEAMYRSEE